MLCWGLQHFLHNCTKQLILQWHAVTQEDGIQLLGSPLRVSTTEYTTQLKQPSLTLSNWDICGELSENDSAGKWNICVFQWQAATVCWTLRPGLILNWSVRLLFGHLLAQSRTLMFTIMLILLQLNGDLVKIICLMSSSKCHSANLLAHCKRKRSLIHEMSIYCIPEK